MKQSVELHGTPLARKHFIIECFIWFYAIIRLGFTAFIIRINFETNPKFLYKIERDDPVTHYFKQNSHIYNESMPLMILAMGAFNFICQYHLYMFNAEKSVWKSWYELLVTNQDDYYRFRLHDHHLIKMAKANKISQRINFLHGLRQFIISLLSLYLYSNQC